MLLDVPTLELMKLWAELVEAYHGHNGYGGDTAELYACRFQRNDPRLAHENMRDEARRENGIASAPDLVELVELFCEEYDCAALIDGHAPTEWSKMVQCFDHRAHVKIVRVDR